MRLAGGQKLNSVKGPVTPWAGSGKGLVVLVT